MLIVSLFLFETARIRESYEPLSDSLFHFPGVSAVFCLMLCTFTSSCFTIAQIRDLVTGLSNTNPRFRLTFLSTVRMLIQTSRKIRFTNWFSQAGSQTWGAAKNEGTWDPAPIRLQPALAFIIPRSITEIFSSTKHCHFSRPKSINSPMRSFAWTKRDSFSHSQNPSLSPAHLSGFPPCHPVSWW